MTKILVAATGLLALTACPPSSKCDSADSGCYADSSETGASFYDGATYIGIDTSNPSYPTDDSGSAPASAIGWDCDSQGYIYDFYTVGWTGGGVLDICQTGVEGGCDTGVGWKEEGHPVDSYDYDPDGWWDNLYLTLDSVSSPGDVVLGSTTLFQCDGSMELTLTWRLTVYDTNNAEADCAVWGDDPSYWGGACQQF